MRRLRRLQGHLVQGRPRPGHHRRPRRRHVNFYVCNGAVISSQFGHATADAAAELTLKWAFPGRTIEQLNTDSLGAGGGGIHCVTQQQPAA
ncbi:agmatine deiminase family protein [Streptomyces sp. NPDC099050]|uniref:agmatine deiminase family protein n=1 Tax=Streptomyces sp. NPDC099050 TaxID=3366100 RepID=UPI003800B823